MNVVLDFSVWSYLGDHQTKLTRSYRPDLWIAAADGPGRDDKTRQALAEARSDERPFPVLGQTEPSGNGSHMKNGHSRLYMGIASSSSSAGAHVVQGGYSSNPSQYWHFVAD